jgi:hypothetical protein
MTFTTPTDRFRPSHPPVRPLSSTHAIRWSVPVSWVNAASCTAVAGAGSGPLAWLALVFFLTAAAFGLPLQEAVDLLPPGNPALGLVGTLLGCAAALGCYALVVRLGEGRWAAELAVRPALSGLASGAVLGLLMMAGAGQHGDRGRTEMGPNGGPLRRSTTPSQRGGSGLQHQLLTGAERR